MINLEPKYLEALGKGDHHAFDMLFTQYHPKVKFFLTGFIKDEETARDMAQDIFFKVWTNREAISKVGSFKNYLFRMAKNMIYDYYEHSLIKEKYKNKLSEQTRNNYTNILEEDLFAKELSLLIDIVIEKMPPQRKLIYRKSRNEGLSNEQIAQELNISKRTV
ncbi:MAG: RNA polymerase sigma-70 factor, partial [Tannerellaceae bacterium]|nr:RNA polymerase sigma-70 factor [Tannerellaceae bacterium]